MPVVGHKQSNPVILKAADNTSGKNACSAVLRILFFDKRQDFCGGVVIVDDLTFCGFKYQGIKYYADESNINVKSRRAANRVMHSTTRYLSSRLKLKVNESLLLVDLGGRVFLGFTFSRWLNRRISRKTLRTFKDRIRELRKRGVSRDLAWNTAKSAYGPWRLSRSPGLAFVLPAKYFASLGVPRLFIKTT